MKSLVSIRISDRAYVQLDKMLNVLLWVKVSTISMAASRGAGITYGIRAASRDMRREIISLCLVNH